MSVVVIAADIEMEFASGVWTSMATAPGYFDTKSAPKWSRGVGPDRKRKTSTMTFTLDNSNEAFTPGNSSGTYFNQLRKGVGVRLSSTYSATKRYHFRGIITDFRPYFPTFGAAQLRVDITCEGTSSLLAAYETYSMDLQQGKDVDDVLTAMMVAAGSTLYSFEDSNAIIPYAYARGDVLSDLAAAAQSEPFGLFFDDGAGLLRNKKNESMTGGFGSPAHTWGATLAPNEGVQPDYRNDSQFARLTLSVASLRPTTSEVVLYRHPYNADNGAVELLAPATTRRISGQFDAVPVSVRTKFSQRVASQQDTGLFLYAGMNDSQTTLTATRASSTVTFTLAAGDGIRVDDEQISIVAVIDSSNSSRRTYSVIRGVNGTIAALHTLNQPGGTPIYKRNPTVTLVDIGVLIRNITASDTSIVTIGSQAEASLTAYPVVGEDLLIDAESMTVSSITTSATLTVNRAGGGVGVPHSIGARIYRKVYTYTDDVYGPSHIKSSANVDGTPADRTDIVGAASFTGGNHIRYLGRNFDADIYNQAAGTRALSDLIIGGHALVVSETPQIFAYEKAIPGIAGIPDGGTVAVPYGLTDAQAVFAGQDEVQTIRLQATGGTFRLTLAGNQTVPITWQTDDAAFGAAILAALEALANIGAGNVDVSIVTVSSSPYIFDIVITFIEGLGKQPIDPFTLQSSLTGAPTWTITETTRGESGTPAGEARIAKGYAMGLLRAGRVQTPWLTVLFMANQSDNVTSMLTAEIGDLVKYTGTGTWREKINDWYRILSIDGEIDEDEMWWFTMQLAPAHTFRVAAKCWFSDFSHVTTTTLGELDIAPPAVSPRFANDSQWKVAAPPSTDPVRSPMRAHAPGVASPSMPVVNVGGADMVVSADWVRGVAGHNSFAANTGGYGIVFRANASASQHWRVFANPTQNLIYLWNTNAGVVASAPWTAADNIEPEVRAMGNRIRVYRDCLGEPIIDVESTLYQTNTYAGIGMVRTISSGGGINPYCTSFYGQAL